MTPIWTIFLVIFGTMFGAAGSFYLKKGSFKVSRNPLHWILNPRLILGISLYMLSSLFFITGLKYGDLSILYPITSMSYVWVIFLSMKYLKEKMNVYKWAGMGFIILGVVLIGIAA